MPLSTCSVAASLRRARLAALRQASICSMLFSTGIAPAADAGVFGAGCYAVEHMDFWRAAKRRAQCQRFAELRDEEYRAAFGAERRGHLGRAQAVAVGLDDACRSRRRRACA